VLRTGLKEKYRKDNMKIKEAKEITGSLS